MKNSSYFEGRSDAYRDAAEHLELVVKMSEGNINDILLQLRHDYLMFGDAAEKAQIHAEMDEMTYLEKIKEEEFDLAVSAVD
ncbi:MAG TPA: hypothetical protein PLZ78_08970 [Spirochaetota bacterium]|nr:hypothetical protein [Spirochaetota bacterium]